MTTQQRNKQLQVHQDKIENRVKLSRDMLVAMQISPEAFARVALNALILNPAIGECTPESVEKTVITAINTGLLLDNREAAIVPYKKQATFQPMVDGLVKLVSAATTGVVLASKVVYAGDEFVYEDGMFPILKHTPSRSGDRSDAAVEAAWATARIPGQEQPAFEVMFRGEIDRIKALSPSQNGPWKNHYPEMARKTVLKRLLKRMPHGKAGGFLMDDALEYMETGEDQYPPITDMPMEDPREERPMPPRLDRETGEILDEEVRAAFTPEDDDDENLF